MGALRPEYIDKVAVLISLGPFGYMHHSAPLNALLPVFPLLVSIVDFSNVPEVLNYNSSLMSIERDVCCSVEFSYNICMKEIFFPTVGTDERNFEPEFSPMLFGHYSAGTSKKVLVHMGQG